MDDANGTGNSTDPVARNIRADGVYGETTQAEPHRHALFLVPNVYVLSPSILCINQSVAKRQMGVDASGQLFYVLFCMTDCTRAYRMAKCNNSN